MATQPIDALIEANTPDSKEPPSAGTELGQEPERHTEGADSHEELQAIGAEIDRIRASVAHIAEASSHYLKRRVAENSTDLIAERPLRAVLWAALAGFVVGRFSR
jgi:hypothetical protein